MGLLKHLLKLVNNFFFNVDDKKDLEIGQMDYRKLTFYNLLISPSQLSILEGCVLDFLYMKNYLFHRIMLKRTFHCDNTNTCRD